MAGVHAAATAGAPSPGVDPAAVVELRGVRKTYRTGAIEFEALRGVDVTITAGEYVAIIGPSGSGKSTLMNLIGCLDVVTAGTCRLGGYDVSALDESRLARIRNEQIGFVFQQFHLLASLPAWRNVELPLVYRGVPARERRARAVAALERVGLGDRTDNRPGELSGGQQQRVAVARALVGEPALILADEPTGNLDSTSAADVLALLRELNDQGRTIVLVTHDAETAANARRVLRVRDGLIRSDRGAA